MSATILLVDDDPTCLEILKQLLEEYTIDTAANGAKALEKLKDKNYDLVITDLMMPEMDGLQVIAGCQPGKVALCTGKAQLPDGLEGVPVIRKPFNYDQILDKVKELLHAQQDLAV